jgi:hypothetical protein
MASKRLRDAVGIDPDRVVSAALEAALGELEQPHKKRHPGRVLAAGAALAAAAAVGQRRLPRMAKLPLRMGLHKLEDMAHVDVLADALHDRADALRDRLATYGEDADADDEEGFDDEPEDDLPEDAEGEDFDDEDEDDLDDEGGDDFDDGPEDDDGPRDEGDGEEPEPEDDEEFEDEPEDEEEFEDEPEDEEELEDEPEDEPEDEELGDVDDEDLPPEEDDEDDEKVAARGLDLGVSSRRDAGSARGRAPDLFEALRSRPRRAPVGRRGSRRVDPASRPPEPSAGRHPDERRGSSRKSKPTTARA